MTTQKRKVQKVDKDDRLTFRIEPALHEWIKRAAEYMLLDQSKLLRMLLVEYVENHIEELPTHLVRDFRAWRASRGATPGGNLSSY